MSHWEMKVVKAKYIRPESLEEEVAPWLEEGWEPIAFDQHWYAAVLRREVPA